jgi:uncharacterized membrane protein YsdA (DUF1294 family)
MNYIVIYYLLINVLSFFVMGIDKKRAKRGEWRIKETKLWWLAVAGGALGGFMGMRVYHHKTKHTSFKIGFPSIAVIQLFLLISLLKLA